MVRAIRGKTPHNSPHRHLIIPFTCHSPLTCHSLVPGVLVECDPSIKSIILKIDAANNDFVVEELDDQTLVIKDSMLHVLKARLEEVRRRG